MNSDLDLSFSHCGAEPATHHHHLRPCLVGNPESLDDNLREMIAAWTGAVPDRFCRKERLLERVRGIDYGAGRASAYRQPDARFENRFDGGAVDLAGRSKLVLG